MRKFLPNLKVDSPFKKKATQVPARSTDSLDDDDDRSERSNRSNRSTVSTPKKLVDSSPLVGSEKSSSLPFTSVSEVKRSIQQEKDLYVFILADNLLIILKINCFGIWSGIYNSYKD